LDLVEFEGTTEMWLALAGSGVAMSIEKIKDYYNMGNRGTQEEGDWI